MGLGHHAKYRVGQFEGAFLRDKPPQELCELNVPAEACTLQKLQIPFKAFETHLRIDSKPSACFSGYGL
jgi:hypothetical protein